MSVELILTHTGRRRGAEVLPLDSGEYLEILPGQTKHGVFSDEYAELLKQRAKDGDTLQIVDAVSPTPEPELPLQPQHPPPLDYSVAEADKTPKPKGKS